MVIAHKNKSIEYASHNAENLVFEQATDIELAWLAGIWDGEGSISFQTTRRKNGNLVVVPFLSMVNTDVKIIDKVKNILDKIGVGYKESWIIDELNPKHLKRCNIRIDRFTRVKNLIQQLYPFLNSRKRECANVVLEFIKEREENLLERNKPGQIVRNKYPQWLIKKVASIRTHKRAIPLEELLACPNVA